MEVAYLLLHGELPNVKQKEKFETNRLETPRIVCSEINEVTRLTTMPKNKSVTLGVQFNTEDTNLSPVLDVMNGTIVYERSRLNSPIDNYPKKCVGTTF